MSYLNKTVSGFLKELSAKTPVPGGGAAAALTGALGTGLLSMAGRYSLRKHPPSNKRLRRLLREALRLKGHFEKLIDEDVRNYLEVVRASRLVKYLPERRQRPFMEPSLRKALASALNICHNAHSGILLSRVLLEKGNPHLVSDVATAVALLNGGFSSARFLCEANLASLKNPQLARRTARLLSLQERDIRRVTQQFPGRVHGLMRIERRHAR